MQKDDVAWINPFNEGGVDAVERTLATLDRLARLPLRLACSGHGPITPVPLASIDAARRRYEKWLADSRRAAWHACKRIFAYALIIYGGLAEADVAPYLLRCPWFRDYGRHYFGLEPAEFIQPLLAEMLRAQAATWQDGRLVALAPPYTTTARLDGDGWVGVSCQVAAGYSGMTGAHLSVGGDTRRRGLLLLHAASDTRDGGDA